MRAKIWGCGLAILVFLIACPAEGEAVSLITDDNWEDMNERIGTHYISPLGKRFVVDHESEDARGVKRAVDAEAMMRVLEFSSREHLVHYSPRPDAAGGYDFLLNLDMKYEVLESAPIFLRSDDRMSYWHIRNYETGKRGAVYSREELDLSSEGIFRETIPVYKAFRNVEKGTSLITRHHFYAIYDKTTGDKLDYSIFHQRGAAQPWRVTDYREGGISFHPDLLFLVANLESFELSFEDLRYGDGDASSLRVKVALVDGDGEKFFLPRADVRARITWDGKEEEITLLPAMYPHAIPKFYFECDMPEGKSLTRFELKTGVNFIDSAGKSRSRIVRREYSAGEIAPFRAEDGPEPPGVEIRALFQHTGWVGSRESVDKTIENMKRANMNLLLAQYLRHGYAAWQSEKAPRIYEDVELDPVQYALKRAHENDIEVHGVVWPYYYPGGEREFRQMVSIGGQKLSRNAENIIVCYYDSDYREYLVDVVEELVRNYEIDGVNLDGIRTRRICFCDYCRETYEEEHGYSLEDDYLHNFPYPGRLTEWLEGAVTGLVEAIHHAVKGIDPEVKISICAYVMSTPGDREMTVQGQPAHVWLEKGLIDFAVPMVYHYNIWESVIRAKEYMVEGVSSERIVPMIRTLEDFIFRKPERMRRNWSRRPELILAQIEAARREGFSNTGFYFGGWLVEEQVEALREGPFREKAVLPWRD